MSRNRWGRRVQRTKATNPNNKHPRHIRRRASRGGDLSIAAVSQLTGTYPDDTVIDFATQDAGAMVYTPAWGHSTNNWPHSIDGIDASAKTAINLIAIKMLEDVTSLEDHLEHLSAEQSIRVETAMKELDSRELAELAVDRVREQAENEGLTLPEHAWRRVAAELAAFVTLGIGDLYFTATAFELFGLSDKQVPFLPLNELQLAATSVVSAMLLLTWLGGHQARGAAHRLTQLGKGTSGWKWGWVTAAACLVADIGGFLVLKGLSDVRTSFLAQQGFNAEQSAFFSIQLGVAVAGFSLAFWMASPLHQKWRSVTHNLAKATKTAVGACLRVKNVVGTYNATVRQRIALLQRYRAWAEGIGHDAIRKDHLLVGHTRAAFAEPVADATLPSKITGPLAADSYLVTEIDALMAGKPSTLKDYPELDMKILEGRLKEIDARREARHTPPARKKR